MFPPGEAREDWAIIRALSDVLGKTLGYDNAEQLRAKIYETAPHLAAIDQREPSDHGDLKELAKQPVRTTKAVFVSPVKDFYLTNPISRASAVMAECSALRAGKLADAAE